MSPDAPPPLPPDVLAAVQSGHKIDAIKLLRDHTGMGLTEAKAAVDALAAGIAVRPHAHADSGPKRVVRFTLIGLALAIALYVLLLRR